MSYPHSLNVRRLIEANGRRGVLKLTTFPTRNRPSTKFFCASKPLYETNYSPRSRTNHECR